MKVDRVACPWLIKRFVDPAAELLFVPADHVITVADREGAVEQPESAGLNAIAEGFRHLGFHNDHEINAAEWIVYDALYAYCQQMIRRGRPRGASEDAIA